MTAQSVWRNSAPVRSYVLGRLLQLVGVVMAALIIVFFLLQVVADPALTSLPLGTPDSAVEEFRRIHGLSDPLFNQFISFMGGAFVGDFGDSLWLEGDALRAALSRVPLTLQLVVPAIVLGTGCGVWLGVVASRRPEGALSQLLNVAAYGLASLAEFWVGIMAILLFAVYLGWLPTSGTSPRPQVMILPVAVLALRPFAQTFQVTRSTMTAERTKQYVMTARARGLDERQVARRHILKNAALPVLTLSFYQLSYLLVGAAVIVEVVFGWPGIGRLAVSALQRGDVFLVQALVMVAAIVTASFNLVADLLCLGLDPRTRGMLNSSPSASQGAV